MTLVETLEAVDAQAIACGVPARDRVRIIAGLLVYLVPDDALDDLLTFLRARTIALVAHPSNNPAD